MKRGPITTSLLAASLIAVFYGVLGLVVLVPEAVYSGDIGLKYVQAHALAASGFESLAIPYPGALLDPDRRLFPIRPPFVLIVDGEPQSIFSPAAAILHGGAALAAGIRGLTIISVVSGACILFCAMALVGREHRLAVAVVLGLGSPLWFYAANGWEHAPAVACSTAAFVLAGRSPGGWAAVGAGVLVGTGAALRDEVLLVLPGLLAVLWFRQRRAPLLGVACAGVAVALVAAGAIDVYWFGRPAAAHLRHAVHMVQSALQITQEPNLEIPSLQPFTLHDRYAAVVNYWLFGSTPNPLIYGFAVSLVAAFVVPARFRAWVAATVIAAVCVAAGADTFEVLTAPKWLAGLFHLAPYMTFVFLPRPRALRDSWPSLVLFGTAAYLLIAFAGVDTSGGKSLGPRLLLPLLPLLATAAVVQIHAYIRGTSVVEVATGWMGVALCLLALGLHVGGTMRAYYGRNTEDGAAVLAAAAATERIVIADDPFTAQLFFPLYYRKILLLADTSEAAEMAGRSLADTRMLGGVLLVSRELEPRVRLDPLRLHGVRQIGRMTLQHWRR